VASAVPHLQPFLEIKQAQLLVAQQHAFPPKQDLKPPITEPTAVHRQLPQPGPDPGIIRTLRPITTATL
jgi:hypothetical protein